MAIRFVQRDVDAPKPAEAEGGPESSAVEPDAPPEPAAEPPASEARTALPVPPAGEAGPAAAEPKPRARRKPAARPAEAAAAAPAQDEAAPLLFPDLPLHPRPDRKARRNRRGFG